VTEAATQEPVEQDGQAPLPLAETLDDATLRRVFASCPEQLDVPRDVSSIWKRRMRGIQPVWKYLGAAAILAGLLSMLGGYVGAGAVLAGGALVGAIIVACWQYSKASDDFFDLYATARGLAHSENGRVDANVPLFSKGDKRAWPRVLTGTIAGQPARLGHYTYTEISTDSDGDRDETDYHFTYLAFRLPEEVAARYKGVYCSPKGLTLGKLQDKLAHDRGITLESLEFHKRYTLRCVDDQDDIALYELFSTPFVQLLSTNLTAYWEQRDGDLVFWKKGHEKEAADLDRFCLESWHVLQRYLEEWR
jgi:hypothetical protein